jgi:hypothetical protein
MMSVNYKNSSNQVSRRQIIEFGLVFFLVLSLIIPLVSLWKNDWVWQSWLDWSLSAGITILILSLTTGTKMAPIYLGWMKLAMVLGTVMTALIVSLVYLFIITPIGLLKRLFRSNTDYHKDLDPTLKSYWVDTELNSDPERMEKMY